MADHGCHPLWSLDEPRNIDPATLPLAQRTCRDLRAWAAAHDATLNLDDPGATRVRPVTAAALEAEGHRLWEQLQHELGPQFEVLIHPETAAASLSPDPETAAAPPCVDVDERQRLRMIFARMAAMEQGCAAGHLVRSFVAAPDNRPAGIAWVPDGLPEVPHLDHDRVVELRGPGGQELLFVPLFELPAVLRQAAADRGVSEHWLRPLASLESDSPEVAVNGLMELICKLAPMHALPVE